MTSKSIINANHIQPEREEDDRKILDFVAGAQQRNDQIPWEQLRENCENTARMGHIIL